MILGYAAAEMSLKPLLVSGLWNPVVSCGPATLMNRPASTRLLTGRNNSIRVCRLTHTHAG